MRPSYVALALVLGLVLFAAIEAGGAVTGTLTGIGRSAPIDAAAYALGTLLLALALARPFRRARGVALAGAVLLFLVLYAPVVAALAGAFELTASGAWGVPGLLRSAFIAAPVNLVVTFALDLWFVALPLLVAGVLLLVRQSRAQSGARRRARSA